MVWVLLLWAVPGEGPDVRERLAEAIRDARPAEARLALTELLAGSHARAARAIFVSLPRARDRAAAACAATVGARLEYDRIDSDFSFNPFDDRHKQKQLAATLEIIKEASRKAVDAEQVYDTLREAISSLGPEGTDVLAGEVDRTSS